MSGSEINQSQIKEMIKQLRILVTKQEGYGMSFSDPSRTNGTPSINLYGNRAKSAIWLFKNAENVASVLETLFEERLEYYNTINLKASFIETDINDLSQKDQNCQELIDFIKANESEMIIDCIPSQLGRIIWNENPLNSVLELTDLGKHYLKLKIIIQEQEELMGRGHYVLSKDDLTLNEAKDIVPILNPEFVERRVETLMIWYLNALSSSHCGDCTCIPASCIKCNVEGLLSLSTIKGLSKYAGNAINREFNNHSNIDEVIVALRDYVPYAEWNGWEEHIPRWKQQSTDAHNWLLNYKNNHFP